MRTFTTAAVVVLLGASGFAHAESNDRYNGKYLVAGAKHMAPARKGNSNAPRFNPKEISIDQSVPWQKAPKDSSRQMKSRSPHLMD